MTALDWIAAAAVAVSAVVAMTWLSHVPVSSNQMGDRLLRLAWRARPERIETCVAPRPETQVALPPHMRQALICTGASASYRLEVRRNGQVIAEQLSTAGGLRGDRPLYVLREIHLPEGDATITITFTRVETPAAQDAEHTRRETLTEALPASLTWEQRLSIAPGQVRVISYDPERQVLFEVRSQ